MSLVHASGSYRPERVVVLGSAGFIGSAVIAKLEATAVEILPVTREQLDLTAEGVQESLADILREGDSLVVAAAQAPVKNNRMLIDNLRMAEGICGALDLQAVAHLVYISSDAVYADGPLPLSEQSPAAPTSLHGVMHLARELMFAGANARAFTVIRPTLVYGAGDPHGGYGPNQFVALAEEGEPIILFGEGEERRDHVHINDVAELTGRVVMQGSEGVLNVATGVVVSFKEVAEMVSESRDAQVEINTRERTGPMPHDGYRPFDPAATREAFPDFEYRSLREGIHIQ